MHYRLHSLTINGRPVPDPTWTRQQALAHLKDMGFPWLARAWFSAKWILFRGRSIKVGRVTVTLHDQPQAKPLRWQ
jgi:hypothetical protein